jgi:uncharacterized protein
MNVFVDTSAFFALLSSTDPNHAAAVAAMERIEREGISLVTTGHVVHETIALVQARLGLKAALAFDAHILPLLTTVWVDVSLHRQGIRRLTLRAARKVSLTDCISFVLMEERGIIEALAFDRHFEQEGFTLFA